jgi:glutamate racemase
MTARAVAERLRRTQVEAADDASPIVKLIATDAPKRFARVGAVFLGAPIAESAVEIVDL